MEATSPILENVCISENDGRKDDTTLNNASVVEKQSQRTEQQPPPSKPIDVDEVSTDELLAFDETSAGEHLGDTSVRSTNTTTDNCNTAKATEFVIVNTANVACIDSEDETETTDRFPMDIQIKEPNIADAVSGNDAFENDPMDLLEPNDRSEITGSTKSSVKAGSRNTNNITDWVKEYPWLLYDEDDDVDGYCLYCDAKLNIKSHYNINMHNLSLYHKEQCDNYLAFREEEQRHGLCTPLVEIKQEFGTDSRVAALQFKRKTQTEALGNFNWRRWLEERPWLEREGADGAIGRCKYCRVRLNVEFSYLRERHQETTKHKECEKQHNEESNDQHNNSKNDSGNIEEVMEEIASVVDKSKNWCEVQRDDPQLVRCKVCDSKMIKSSFAKHLRSNLHAQNVSNYLQELKQKKTNSSSINNENEYSTKDKESEKQHNGESNDQHNNSKNDSGNIEEVTEEIASVVDKSKNWCEVQRDDPQLVRCKVCDSKMIKSSFAKHLRSNLHAQNVSNYLQELKQKKTNSSSINNENEYSTKHKESEKQHNGDSNDQHNNSKKDSGNIEEVTEEIASVVDKSKNWCEAQRDDPQLVRCKVCDSKMIKSSFAKHLRSNLHAQNVSNYLQELKQRKTNSSSINNENEYSRNENWELYTKRHPWMMADPTDPKYGFCKYCEKRLTYGYSVVKRATHENSSHHKYNEKLFKERARTEASKSDKDAADETESENTGDNEENNDDVDQNKDGDDDEEEEEEDEGENEDEDEEDEEEAEGKNDQEEEINEDENEDEEDDEEEDADNDEEKTGKQKKDNKNNSKNNNKWVRSEKWVNQYPWCKRYSKDPKLIFCIYCKMTLSILYPRAKHEGTSAHIAARAKYESKHDKKQEKRNQGNDLFKWVVILRNIPNTYSCKYCRVRISNNYSKKSHAASKLHQINENLYLGNSRKTSNSEENAKVNSSQTPKTVTQSSTNKNVQRFAKVVIKSPSVVTLVKQWQKRFTWLSYKRNELRNHYGYCKTCNTALYIRSLKNIVRHTRNAKHLNLAKSVRKEKVELEKSNTRISAKGLKEELPASSPIPSEMATRTTQKSSEETTKESPKDVNYNSTIEELQKRFSWIDKSHKLHYTFCRYCNVNIPIKLMLIRTHGITVKHRRAVINYSKANKNQNETEASENAVTEENNDEGGNDNDIMVVEDNNEEILISEQDKNLDIKSETMDEHKELDNSHNKRNNQRNNVRKSLNTTEEHPSKRIKRSQSFRHVNDSNTSLVASLFSTPLTLASCLGPFIQQQIQQAANTPTTAVPASPAQALTVEAENTYDLFFKSISETMKKLPVDLAAEGKVKVVQIICDLELQALKRQHVPPICESASNNSSTINYTPTSIITNVSTGQITTSHDVGDGIEQNGEISETVIPFYANVSPPTATSHVAPVAPIPTSSTNVNMAQNTTTTAPTPAIGVMDKNGLQTLHLKPSMSKQIPKTTSSSAVTTVSETVITPFYANVSPPTATSHVATVAPIPTSSTNVNMEQNTTTTAPSPVIGVMDKNGLQTLHLKPSMSKQIPKSTSSSAVTTVSNSAGIRCVPFKNLSQRVSPGEANNKFTHIHVSLSSAQSPNTNVTTTTNTPKGVINFHNIQNTKRNALQTSTSSPSSSAVTTVAPSHIQTQQQQQLQQHHQQQQQRQKLIMVNNSPQRTYVSNIQPHLQRWGCTGNGTSPNKTIFY